MGFLSKRVVSIVVAGCSLLAVAFCARGVESPPADALQAAAARLRAWKARSDEPPSVALKAAMENLANVPRIHTRAFAGRAADPGTRARLLADARALEEILAGVADLTPGLTSASNEELVQSLGLIVEIRERLAEPRAYGNLLANLGLAQYVARVGLHRLFASPDAAKMLHPLLSKNAGSALPEWDALTEALAEETEGKIRSTKGKDTPFNERLFEILLPALKGLVEDDFTPAKGFGPGGVALGAMIELKKGWLTGIPGNLEQVERISLVMHMAYTADVAYASIWWCDFLQKHETVPQSSREFERLLREENLGVHLGGMQLRVSPSMLASCFYTEWIVTD